MNRIHTSISAAILAMAGSVAFANDPAHKGQAADSQSAPVTQQQAPQVQDMDTNAQRAHDKAGGAGANTDGSMGTATPGVQDLDTNAQRAHEPKGGAGAEAGAGVEAAGSSGEARGGADASASGSDANASASGGDANASASGETRDWSQIDADNDNLIGPEEMERALGATGQQAGEPQQQQQR